MLERQPKCMLGGKVLKRMGIHLGSLLLSELLSPQSVMGLSNDRFWNSEAGLRLVWQPDHLSSHASRVNPHLKDTPQ